MYALVLFVHSWLRWFVLLALIGAVLRFGMALRSDRAFTAADKRWQTVVVALLDTQFLLGLLLYFVLSPLTPSSLADLRAQMPIAPLRFFAVEHVTAMLVAVVVAHVFSARAKRSTADGVRFQRLLIGFALALLLILIAIPWPGLKHARPLFRF